MHKRHPTQDTDRGMPKCQHNRLIEGVRDSQGTPTHMLKCCECGALMPRTSQSSQLS